MFLVSLGKVYTNNRKLYKSHFQNNKGARMKRSTIDTIISSMGLLLALVLLIASGVLFFAYNFVHTEVTSQLGAQQITFPAKDSKAFTALPADDQKVIEPYVGQQLTTGAQAKVFADNYIAVHLKNIGGGKTYSQLSALSMADPTNSALTGQVNTVFRGETLRGILLNAYAFDTMALVAQLAAIGALVAGFVLFILSLLGFAHAKKASAKQSKRK